jgi:hypothetical protein
MRRSIQKFKPAGTKKRSTSSDVAALVSSKLEEGDILGAIRLAASDDTMAPFDDVTAMPLRDKHPAHSPSVVPIPLLTITFVYAYSRLMFWLP